MIVSYVALYRVRFLQQGFIWLWSSTLRFPGTSGGLSDGWVWGAAYEGRGIGCSDGFVGVVVCARGGGGQGGGCVGKVVVCFDILGRGRRGSSPLSSKDPPYPFVGHFPKIDGFQFEE